MFKLMMQFYSYIFDEHNPDLLNMIPECRVNFKSNLKSEHYTVIKLMIAWFGIFPLFPKSETYKNCQKEFKEDLKQHKQEITDHFENSVNPSTITGQKFHRRFKFNVNKE